MMDEAYKALVIAEASLDTLNGERGDRTSLCLQCPTTMYDGLVGIIHNPTCIIFVIREWFATRNDLMAEAKKGGA
jgi:hypothetical protein